MKSIKVKILKEWMLSNAIYIVISNT